MINSAPRPLIELKGVSFSYQNQREVISNVNLSVHQSDFLGIIGPNGGGKTTLLQIIVGLLQPTKGTIGLFGKPGIDSDRRKRIGYVSQKSTHFDSNFPITIQEVVEMGRYARVGLLHRLKKEDYEKVETAMDDVDIRKYKNQRISTLSGGLQQRVFIAKALAGDSEILLLDEPTVGVDIAAQQSFYELLHHLHTDLHKTIVLVSHDIETIAKETTRIACVNKTVICDDNPKEFMKGEGLHHLYGEGLRFITHDH